MFVEELHRGCLTKLLMRLRITDVTKQGNLGPPPFPNSPDLYQKSMMKSCADSASSFP